jgi:hypothetical protein
MIGKRRDRSRPLASLVVPKLARGIEDRSVGRSLLESLLNFFAWRSRCLANGPGVQLHEPASAPSLPEPRAACVGDLRTTSRPAFPNLAAIFMQAHDSRKPALAQPLQGTPLPPLSTTKTVPTTDSSSTTKRAHGNSDLTACRVDRSNGRVPRDLAGALFVAAPHRPREALRSSRAYARPDAKQSALSIVPSASAQHRDVV